MHVVFSVGTAGSGKSTLTSALREWLEGKGWDVATVNLDPGARSLPYEPDADVRSIVDLDHLIEEHGLGPNGALMLAVDLAAARLGEVLEPLDEASPDFVLVDTPGQMEPFVYRPSGPLIVRQFPGTSKAILFLMDGWLVSDPLNYVSVQLLAASVRLRFPLPFIQLLTKADMVEDSVQRILRWSAKPSELEAAVSGSSDGEIYLMHRKLLSLLARSGYLERPIPVSSVTRAGFLNLSSALANALTGGEDVQDRARRSPNARIPSSCPPRGAPRAPQRCTA
ncbi:MAG: ATP/GTP-binding protein [Conexivisphaera sp.]